MANGLTLTGAGGSHITGVIEMLDQLKNLKSLAGLMGNAQQFRDKFEQVQAELARKTVTADAGAGAVRVVARVRMHIVRSCVLKEEHLLKLSKVLLLLIRKGC